jgi:hypothetical protein
MTRELLCAKYSCFESTEIGRRRPTPDEPARANEAGCYSNGANAASGFGATL